MMRDLFRVPSGQMTSDNGLESVLAGILGIVRIRRTWIESMGSPIKSGATFDGKFRL